MDSANSVWSKGMSRLRRILRQGFVLALLFGVAAVTEACGSGTQPPAVIRNPIDASDRLDTQAQGTIGVCQVIDAGVADCGGTASEIHSCIINTPTKSGIQVTVPKPTINYQTCTPY